MSHQPSPASPYYAHQLVLDEAVTATPHVLRFKPEPGTIVVHRGPYSMVDDTKGKFCSMFGGGTIDYETREMSVEFTEESQEPTTVDYEYDTERNSDV